MNKPIFLVIFSRITCWSFFAQITSSHLSSILWASSSSGVHIFRRAVSTSRPQSWPVMYPATSFHSFSAPDKPAHRDTETPPAQWGGDYQSEDEACEDLPHEWGGTGGDGSWTLSQKMYQSIYTDQPQHWNHLPCVALVLLMLPKQLWPVRTWTGPLWGPALPDTGALAAAPLDLGVLRGCTWSAVMSEVSQQTIEL